MPARDDLKLKSALFIISPRAPALRKKIFVHQDSLARECQELSAEVKRPLVKAALPVRRVFRLAPRSASSPVLKANCANFPHFRWERLKTLTFKLPSADRF